MKFRYKAKNKSGQNIQGTVEALNAAGAAELLRNQNLVPINLSEIKPGMSFDLSSIMGGVKQGDMANFTRQLSTMITSGLPLTDALNLLRVQSGPVLGKVVGLIMADVQSGVSLSAAMSKHPKIFSKVYVSLVKAGEAAGVMETILNRLADNAEKGREFRAKVTGAMIYPVIILVGMVGVMILMIIVVIPKLQDLYKDFGEDLPPATQAVMAISNFATNYFPLLVIMVLGTVFGVKWFLGTEFGRKQWDTFIYKIPVIGPLARQVMLTELTRTLALLVSAGVSIVEALMIVSEAVDNVVVRMDVKRISRQVEKGFPVSISFSESPIFPPIIGQMVAVGEETGKLDDVLAKVSHYFESESDEKIKGLTSAIEPLILIVMAIGIGFLMYAIVMPIYGITNKI